MCPRGDISLCEPALAYRSRRPTTATRFAHRRRPQPRTSGRAPLFGTVHRAHRPALRVRQDRRRRPRPRSRRRRMDVDLERRDGGGDRRAGLPVTDVAEVTGLPAILGHRVVTLHPKIHGGILADLDDPEHRHDLEQHGIEPIALVVVNLYPFASDPSVQLIDIGGPAMVRAAAKNHAHVGVVVDPADYETVLDEISRVRRAHRSTRRRLARDAFVATAAYDTAITSGSTARSAVLGGAPTRCQRGAARAAGDTDAAPGAGAGPALRREPTPAGRPLPHRRWRRLVGHRDAARRQAAQLPQPVRRRGGLATRAPLRRAGMRHRQARQPVRRARSPPTSRPRTSGPTRVTRSARSAASSPSTGHCRRPPRRRWRRSSPRSSSRRRTTTRHWRR